MSEIFVETPSGLTGTLRGMQGSEVDYFANKKNTKRGGLGSKILERLWVKTEAPGRAYTVADDGAIDWDTTLRGDRFYLYLMARVATFGPIYSFQLTCPHSDCEQSFYHDLNLLDLDLQPYSTKSINCFRDDNRFVTNALGFDVGFQLVTGRIETKLDAVERKSKQERMSAALAQRILSVEAIGDDREKIQEWLRGLDQYDLLELTESMDDSDGGYETSIDVECPWCQEVIEEVELPLDHLFKPDRRNRALNRNFKMTLKELSGSSPSQIWSASKELCSKPTSSDKEPEAD